MSDVFAQATAYGVLPVIAIEDATHAVALADALAEGGLPVAEVTFRTKAAADVMARMTQERPDFLVGAGTVLDLDSLAAARHSGAKFGLAPGFDPAIVDEALASGWAFAPGIMTPSEISAAMRRGVKLMKFFPRRDRCAAARGAGPARRRSRRARLPPGGTAASRARGPGWGRPPHRTPGCGAAR